MDVPAGERETPEVDCHFMASLLRRMWTLALGAAPGSHACPNLSESVPSILTAGSMVCLYPNDITVIFGL